MQNGTIARVMDKGYGFVKGNDGEKDLFFHANDLQGADFNSLKEGMAVTYEVIEGRKGPQATNVKLA